MTTVGAGVAMETVGSGVAMTTVGSGAAMTTGGSGVAMTTVGSGVAMTSSVAMTTGGSAVAMTAGEFCSHHWKVYSIAITSGRFDVAITTMGYRIQCCYDNHGICCSYVDSGKTSFWCTFMI